jgi:Cu+-exporting ATPase
MIQAYRVDGMTCQGCRKKVETTLSKIDGVNSLYVELPDLAVIEFEDSAGELESLQKALSEAGRYTIVETSLEKLGVTKEEAKAKLEQSDNDSCCHHSAEQEIKHTFDESDIGKYYCPMFCEGDKVYPEFGACPVCGMNLEVIEGNNVHDIIYTCPNHDEIQQDSPGNCPKCGLELIPQENLRDDAPDENYLQLLKKFKVAVIFTLPIFIIAMSEMIPNNPLYQWLPQKTWNWIQLGLSIPVVFYACWMFFERAWTSIKTFNLNMFTLIGIGAGVAWLFSLVGLIAPGVFPDQFKTEVDTVHVYFEAASVILTLVLLGQLLESRAHGKTNQAIKELLKLTPATAIKIVDGEEKQVTLDQVSVDDFVRVKPGGKVPVDGTITEGHSDVDESMISGEPIPVNKDVGDVVSAGTINGSGSLVIKATKVGKDTLLSKVIEMVNDASRSKAPIQKLADRVAKYFVPAVVIVAILTFIIWATWGPAPAYAYAIVNAIAVLIIACPCALGLATPMSVMVGVGRGAQSGILIKNAEVLEKTNQIDTLIVDKTGTLTQGKPSVEEVIVLDEAKDTFSSENPEDSIAALIASLNQPSEHSLATATVDFAKKKELKLKDVSHFKAHSGQGVSGRVDDSDLLLGNAALLKRNGVHIDKTVLSHAEQYQSKGKTISYLAINDSVTAFIVIGDKLKESSFKAIQRLKASHIDVLMMTGDNQATAQHVANELDIKFEAECMPEDKLNRIKELQGQGKIIAMAGDGINDAPALAQADVGIAMGTGTDVAIESAEITLIKGDLLDIEKAYKLSHKTMQNIKQNMFFAFIYNGLGIPLAAGVLYPVFGLLMSPMVAALAMSFSSVSVITNSLRLRKANIE